MIRPAFKRSTQPSLGARGEPMVWLSGGMFAIACLMIISLLGFVLWEGLSTLWPKSYPLFGLKDGSIIAGELYGKQVGFDEVKLYLRTGNYDVSNRHFAYVSSNELRSGEAILPEDLWLVERKEWGNLYGFPKRLSWSEHTDSNLTSQIDQGLRGTRELDRKIDSGKRELKHLDQRLSSGRLAIRRVELAEKVDLQPLVELALSADSVEGSESSGADQQGWGNGLSARAKLAIDQYVKLVRDSEPKLSQINEQIAALEGERGERTIVFDLPITDSLGEIEGSWDDFSNGKVSASGSDLSVFGLDGRELDSNSVRSQRLSEGQVLWSVDAADGVKERFVLTSQGDGKIGVSKLREQTIALADVVRYFAPNRLSVWGKLGIYGTRWWEFLFGEPREAGIEGGFFPAIWGTIVMTVLMSLAVMPFGVLAALYMREYAKSGWLLTAIRICINNLAGIPSIVYGVFGLSFFCYVIGGYLDGGPVKAGFEPWPSAVWFAAFGFLVVLSFLAFSVSLMSGGLERRIGWMGKTLRWGGGLLWLSSLVLLVFLFAKSPFFHGFFEAELPNPTFGKGCLLWAACTLALLTLPVVIVATEEALAAVPNSLREGSYACGAGQWQTIHRIVIPYARPGIITGFILAMARGAGEVAPMMLVGAIPLATELPLDTEYPFVHGSRSFMHLGFQIYSLGFQSQNSEAAKPMVFTATLLLLTIVTLLNQTAIWLRASLRKRFQSSQF